MRPRVHYFIVFFALGDQAVLVLLLVFLDLLLGLTNPALLGFGNDEVVLPEGDAGLAGILEPYAHQVVREDHGLLLAAMAVHHIDDVGDFLLGQ